MDLKMHKKKFSYMWAALFVMLLVVNMVQVFMSIPVAIINPMLTSSVEFTLIATFVSMHIIGFAVYYLMMKPQVPIVQREKSKMSVKDFIVVFFICMAATYVFNFVSIGINYVIGLIKQSPVVNPLDSAVGGNMFLQVFVLAISAPIIEELVFRKLMLDCLRPYGDKVAIWVTAVAFALFHGNLSQALYAFVLGLIFAYIVIRTNDVRYSIAYHIIINLLGSTIMPMMALSSNQVLVMAAGLLVYVFIIVGVILFILNAKKIVLEKGEITLEKKGRFKTIYLNAGMAGFMLMCLSMFIMVILLPAA